MRLRENAVIDRVPYKSKPDLSDAHGELLERAKLLLPDEQRLIELVLRNQLSRRQLSHLLGLAPGTMCRRVRRVINRLCDPLVLLLLAPGCPLAPEMRQLALEHWLQGIKRSDLAEKHRITLTEVHRLLEYVRGWYRAATTAR
jgi:DNA-directed RNA polymerase specialized sigma24 family protein